MKKKVLIADDEFEIRNLLRLYLENDGYEVCEVSSGDKVSAALKTERPDICLLDIMMPGKDGLHVLQDIRDESNIPVIIISARTADAERILGLNLGADDYVTKPFNPLEVAARVKAALRRVSDSPANESKEEIIEIGDLQLDVGKCYLSKAGEPIELTSVEFKIMELLMKNPNRVFTKQQIYEYAWGEDFIIADNNIMVAISKLRSKLDDDPSKYIKTLRGLGYRFEAR